MVVKKYFVSKPKEGYQYDRQQNRYFSWGYDIWLDRTRMSERGFFTKDSATAAVKALRESDQNSRHGIAGSRPTSSPFLIELFQKKLDSLPAGVERSRAKRVFRVILSLLPAEFRVIDLRKAHLKTYIDRRTADGVKNATIRRELVPVLACLNNADQYFAELDLYRPPRKPKIAIPKTRRTRTINYDERRVLLNHLLAPAAGDENPRQAAARRRVGLFLQMCLLTVSRPGEIAKLRRSNVDWHSGTLTIIGSKTENKQHSARSLPITATIREILLERFDAPGSSEFLFCRGGKVTPKMYKTLKDACSAVGIPYGKNDPEGITFYTSRHTATTVLAHSNKVDTKTAGDFTGHSDEAMTLYYTHTNAKTLQIASDVLEENMGRSMLDGVSLETS